MQRKILLILYCVSAVLLVRAKEVTHKEPLFGKKYQNYTITSNDLKGSVFYLVSGHGGPDPGCIGHYQGKELHEDEYAYDVILRLGRILMQNGAKVHFIIQDPKDGIRDTYVLKNSKREKCMGKTIPLNQIERLEQRCVAINQLYKKDNSIYKRAVFIHVDSRSRKNQIDVFFYHAPKSVQGEKMTRQMQLTFKQKYKKFQPNRGFDGEVTARNLYVLRNTAPVAAFIEIGNIQNPLDQRRLVIPDNRQALAKWIAEALVSDYKRVKGKKK